ncbi:MAG TPA: transketolase [Caldisericia bacterium]|nr:transketolase [Caldisericia bacterium]HOR46237.1 transketolase [Caldisericia bacterium]HOU08386.1 transketolase [Caldisericia bacterium]HPL88715.1 transketolase [Caldisericia bacterium]HQG59769.1 transketolase [Caldisericia bacterium]
MMRDIIQLEKVGRQIRRDIIQMTALAGSGHPGGSLSATDLMAALYFEIANVDPSNPMKEDRDRIIYSKAHVTPLIYSVLARRGFFDPELLKTFRKLGSPLQGHPHIHCVPGIEMSGGSLGQGISIALGTAIAGKMDKAPWRVYCLMGDGELQEGQVWEAFMAAAHYKADNLTAIIDKNGLEIDGTTKDVMNIDPLEKKLEAFGWHIIECDGHDYGQILYAFDQAKQIKGKPQAVIAHTVKGKGVSFMENNAEWHGKAPNQVETEKALLELAD